jgi:hypothetical protein
MYTRYTLVFMAPVVSRTIPFISILTSSPHADSMPASHHSANSVKKAQFQSDVVPQVGLDAHYAVYWTQMYRTQQPCMNQAPK